jgi:hypothetical protein
MRQPVVDFPVPLGRRGHLKGESGVLASIATARNSKAAWFKDTEGNIMAIIQTIS